MSLDCVIEMEMSQSATVVLCHLTLHSLQCSPALPISLSLFVTRCAQVPLCIRVSVRVCADNTWPFSFSPAGLSGRCENVISW